MRGRNVGPRYRGPGETTGDHAFDESMELGKMNAEVCAALSERARQQLTVLVNGGGSVSQGVVTWPFQDVDKPDRQWLIEHVEHVVTLVELLTVTPDSLPRLLAKNAGRDSNPNVRLRNLRYLIAAETRAPRALVETTCKDRLGDRDPVIRFHAARQLGPEGHPTLRALTANEQAEPALRAQALAALHEGNAASIEEQVASFLRPSPLELTRAALAVVAARRLSAHADRVIALSGAPDASIRAAAARTLSLLESPKLELSLMQRLADEDADVQTAAAEALGTAGSVAAVEPLLLLTKGFGRGQVRQTARTAIARIQSRLGNVEAGRLSLAQDDDLAGAVTLADTEATGGEVTIAADAKPSERTRLP